MRKYLVIGDPVGHSRSPGMQNAAFEAAGLGRPYGRQLVHPEELAEFFEYARENLAGVNLTVPHKLQAAELSDELTPRAEACGSVNTLIISDRRIIGDSTDGIGLEEALKYCFNDTLAGKRIVFCGAGGAARATAVHLAGCGVQDVSFINRTLSKAEELSALCRTLYPDVSGVCTTFADENDVEMLLESADYLIQATSVGLKPDDPSPLAGKFFHPGMKVKIFDTIYHPTALQKIAAANGIACVNGMEMLIRQGAASFELWTGVKPDLSAMRRGFEAGGDGA
ncbi:MAG: shikimate dehydrogenase [Lentisphaerae bacterium]|nr:shikimate dehydrogenase [Lentisphaerota bacterium]